MIVCFRRTKTECIRYSVPFVKSMRVASELSVNTFSLQACLWGIELYGSSQAIYMQLSLYTQPSKVPDVLCALGKSVPTYLHMLHLVLLPVVAFHLMLLQLTPRLHIRIVVTLATQTLRHNTSCTVVSTATHKHVIITTCYPGNTNIMSCYPGYPGNTNIMSR